MDSNFPVESSRKDVMRHKLDMPGRSFFWAFALWGAACLPAISSDVQFGELQIKSVHGTVAYSTDRSNWADLKPGMVLSKGAELKTGPDSTVDLEFAYSGTELRLRPDSLLELARMDEVVAEQNVIIDTRLNLLSGSLIGSQHKLTKPSTFTIATPNGSATIRGTEYLVTSAGAVTCMRGEVAVNSSYQGSPVSTQVPAGFSFDPATCQVATTAPANLKSIDQDTQTVRDNANKLGKDGNGFCGNDSDGDHDHDISPVKGHHHDHDHDHDDNHGHGDNHGDGHGDNHSW
jgi:hypothetical protein